MKRATILVGVLVMMLFLTGCVSLSSQDRRQLRELKGYGISPDEQQLKHPGLAGALNILPGIGNFYLAAGTEESAQWAFGILNLLVWPYSILWGVPQAAIDAGTINKKATIEYYYYDPQGKKELERRKAGSGGSAF